MYFDAKLEMIRLQLHSHFSERKQRNNTYSLRAFARDLGMDPSLLSKLMRGTQRVSLTMYERIATRLGLTPSDLDSGEKLEEARFEVLEADKFSLISDWYHYAIIELMRTKDFKSDPAWIAERLGIGTTEVNIALERLQRLRLIEKTERGHYRDIAGNNSTGAPKNSSLAFRKLQKQLLEKSLQRLDEIPIELRDNSSITVAISTKQLPKLKAHIARFRKEFAKLAEHNPEADEVYNLSVSLFPSSQRR